MGKIVFLSAAALLASLVSTSDAEAGGWVYSSGCRTYYVPQHCAPQYCRTTYYVPQYHYSCPQPCPPRYTPRSTQTPTVQTLRNQVALLEDAVVRLNGQVVGLNNQVQIQDARIQQLQLQLQLQRQPPQPAPKQPANQQPPATAPQPQ